MMSNNELGFLFSSSFALEIRYKVMKLKAFMSFWQRSCTFFAIVLISLKSILYELNSFINFKYWTACGLRCLILCLIAFNILPVSKQNSGSSTILSIKSISLSYSVNYWWNSTFSILYIRFTIYIRSARVK